MCSGGPGGRGRGAWGASGWNMDPAGGERSWESRTWDRWVCFFMCRIKMSKSPPAGGRNLAWVCGQCTEGA